MPLQSIVVYFITIIGSMVLHEMAHAYASYALGDDTAKLQNRLSLNPLRHIDPFLSVLLPMILAMMGAPVFGGAKPVIVNRRKLKYGDFGMAMVAAVGPLTNLLLAILAICFLGVFKFELTSFWGYLLMVGLHVNLGFFLFNMLPLPPLDGSRVIYALAPSFIQRAFDKIESYGPALTLALVLLGYDLISRYISWGTQIFLEVIEAFFKMIGVL